MYKLCVTERSAKNQLVLEKAFLRLALQHNYDDITISDICREAGLSRKVYYRLFENKNDVLYALIDHTLGSFEAYEPEMEPLHRFFSYWKDQRQLLDALDRSQCNALLMDRVVRFVLTYDPSVLLVIYPDLLEWDRDTQIFFISGLYGMMLDWHRRGFDSSVEEISRSLLKLLSAPLHPYG
ncbi:MAG: TetR/AcrR family transcriptional regulator [Eubacteriales bacterium]|nr:TetR/AcrR family transcriptional regulator [Eubacteriales bacterium]